MKFDSIVIVRKLDDTSNPIIDQIISSIKATASFSKIAGGLVAMRSDWNEIKVQVMREILYAKFSQNPELKQKLLATVTDYLEETNTWYDTFWGVCKGKGENWLGKLLMELREKFRMENENEHTLEF